MKNETEVQEATLDQELSGSVKSLQDLMQQETIEQVDEETPADSVEASSETADVKEEPDDTDSSDVPLKNRFAETARKLKRTEERLAELEAKLERTTAVSTENALDNLTGMNFYQQVQQQPQPQVQQEEGTREPSYATREEVLQLTQAIAAKRTADEAALRRFPDLKNPSSLLYKETQKRIQAARASGMSPLAPALVLSAAEAAFGSLIATGAIKPAAIRQDEELERRASVDANAIPISRTAKPNKSTSSNKLTDMDKSVLREFAKAGVKITKEEFLKRKR